MTPSEDSLAEEDRWTDRPSAPLRERGRRDGAHHCSARKGFGASVRAGHCRSCNPAAFQKAPISARSVISKFLPLVQSNFLKLFFKRSTEKHECSVFLLSGGSKSPNPAFFFKNLMASHKSHRLAGPPAPVIFECDTSDVTSVICKMWG